MLDMQDMQEACSSGWEFNWRSSGKAIVCLEPDGCLWRKVDLKTNLPGRKWYDASFDKAAETYNVPFVNYLTRFIINFDPRWQDWWKLRQEALGLKSQAEASIQLQGELNRFAGSVEYGLAKYPGADGARRLLEELHLNYGEAGPEANRQLAIAFSLLAPHLQPVEGMQAILPSGAAKDAKQVALGYETKMRALAIETIKSPLLVDKGVRPAMLPADLPIIRTSDGQSVTFTLPGFERPAHGKESEDIFGARHPGGPVKRERRLEPAIYAAMSAAGLSLSRRLFSPPNHRPPASLSPLPLPLSLSPSSSSSSPSLALLLSSSLSLFSLLLRFEWHGSVSGHALRYHYHSIP